MVGILTSFLLGPFANFQVQTVCIFTSKTNLVNLATSPICRAEKNKNEKSPCHSVPFTRSNHPMSPAKSPPFRALVVEWWALIADRYKWGYIYIPWASTTIKIMVDPIWMIKTLRVQQWWLYFSTHCFNGGWNPRVYISPL